MAKAYGCEKLEIFFVFFFVVRGIEAVSLDVSMAQDLRLCDGDFFGLLLRRVDNPYRTYVVLATCRPKRLRLSRIDILVMWLKQLTAYESSRRALLRA